MRALFIGKVFPEPSSTAAGRRSIDVMQSLQAAGWELHFACCAQPSPHAVDLGAHGISVHSIRVNETAFDPWLRALQPELVLFDRFMMEEQFAWRVSQQCPQALRVIDTSDLHCLRAARQDALKTGGAFCHQHPIALREIAAIYRSDLSLLISDYELAYVQKQFRVPSDLLAYWPFFVDPPSKPFVSFEQRRHFVLLGSLQHAPNLDAARWCLQSIWPRIRAQIPEAELHCYGSYGDRYAHELHQPAIGFHFKGRAENAIDTLKQYRVQLAPLRFGAGLKGKLFDAMESGTPSVSTPIGLEGILGPDCPWGCAISEDPDPIAATAIQLYQEQEHWTDCQAAGIKILKRRFDRSHWWAQLPKIIQQAQANMATRRSANFIGQMLRHHQHRSTEFMSRWIEVKNAASATH
jgi:glycosyltransferase involved in cell wall biosynthesis